MLVGFRALSLMVFDLLNEEYITNWVDNKFLRQNSGQACLLSPGSPARLVSYPDVYRLIKFSKTIKTNY